MYALTNGASFTQCILHCVHEQLYTHLALECMCASVNASFVYILYQYAYSRACVYMCVYVCVYTCVRARMRSCVYIP